MQSVQASKIDLSCVCDTSVWKQTGRYTEQGELLRIRDRRSHDGFILAPTHEESIVALLKSYVQSYRDLPIRLYQVGKKYRDELRPRQGLLRTKEFEMMDLYSFDASSEQAMQTYDAVRSAYDVLFTEIGLPYLTAQADSGSIGGTVNHEYHYKSETGEDVVLTCSACGYTANEEVWPSSASKWHEAGQQHHSSCLVCHSKSIQRHKTIEIGHTFNLASRYSSPLSLCFTPRLQQQDLAPEFLPVQMGCYGIGVSRLIGALATLGLRTTDRSSPVVGLSWPRGLAPFDVVIIPSEQTNSEEAESMYDELDRQLGLEIALDDREEQIGWRCQRAEVIGVPIVLILGRSWDQRKLVEVQMVQSGQTAEVAGEDLSQFIAQLWS